MMVVLWEDYRCMRDGCEWRPTARDRRVAEDAVKAHLRDVHGLPLEQVEQTGVWHRDTARAVELEAILEAVECAARGGSVSDFMMSFSVVRAVHDTHAEMRRQMRGACLLLADAIVQETKPDALAKIEAAYALLGGSSSTLIDVCDRSVKDDTRGGH